MHNCGVCAACAHSKQEYEIQEVPELKYSNTRAARRVIFPLSVALILLCTPKSQAQEKSPDETAFIQMMLKGAITCPGKYGGHQQGMATDRKSAIFWSHTVALAKTDLAGQLLKVVDVPSHSGDLAYHEGKVYVATNLGDFNRENGKRDSWIYVYDAENLALLDKHPVNEVEFGAGGIAYHNGRFIVIGGLPKNYQQNYAYEYDENFKFLKRHVLPTGYTSVGIQSAAYHNGYWWFGCYGVPDNPGLIQVDESFKVVAMYNLNFAWGIIGVEGETLMQGGDRGSAKATHLRPANLFKRKADSSK